MGDKALQRRVVKFGGGVILVADDQPTFWDRVEAGRWEPGTLAIIDRFVDRGACFVDLGAWVGPTALFAAMRGARVIAVEADPAALDQLGRNLAVNPTLAGRITIVPRAVGASAGRLTLGSRRKPGDSMSSVLLEGAATTWSVETVTAAELAAMAGTERLFVKIDIEGGEYGLLPALGPLIDRPAARVLVSFHRKALAESLSGHREQAMQATRRALTIFSGWRAYAVTDEGPTEQPPDAATIASGAAPDEWLFVRP